MERGEQGRLDRIVPAMISAQSSTPNFVAVRSISSIAYGLAFNIPIHLYSIWPGLYVPSKSLELAYCGRRWSPGNRLTPFHRPLMYGHQEQSNSSEPQEPNERYRRAFTAHKEIRRVHVMLCA